MNTAMTDTRAMRRFLIVLPEAQNGSCESGVCGTCSATLYQSDGPARISAVEQFHLCAILRVETGMPQGKSGLAQLLAGVAIAAGALSGSAQQIAFTWDDLPAHSALPAGETRVEIGRKIIAAMKEAHMPPAYGLVNGVRTEEEPLSTPMLKEWRDAGLPLGNHAWSHMNLNQHSLADWKADVLRNEPRLRSYMGNEDWHWLRFPYLAEGDTPEKRQEARSEEHTSELQSQFHL